MNMEMQMTETKCECSDKGCAGCAGKCEKAATGTVRRIDMEDGETTFEFCDDCTTDALASGVFSFEGPYDPAYAAHWAKLIEDHDHGTVPESECVVCESMEPMVSEAESPAGWREPSQDAHGPHGAKNLFDKLGRELEAHKESK